MRRVPTTVFNKVLKGLKFKYKSSLHNFTNDLGETITVNSDLTGDYVFMNDRIVKIRNAAELKRVLED
jgi:hypothetical protein